MAKGMGYNRSLAAEERKLEHQLATLTKSVLINDVNAICTSRKMQKIFNNPISYMPNGPSLTANPPDADFEYEGPTTSLSELEEFAYILAPKLATGFQDFSTKIQDLAKAHKHMRALGESKRGVLEKFESIGRAENTSREKGTFSSSGLDAS